MKAVACTGQEGSIQWVVWASSLPPPLSTSISPLPPPSSMSILARSSFQSQNSSRQVGPAPERGPSPRCQGRGPWPGVSATPEPAVGPGLKTSRRLPASRGLLWPHRLWEHQRLVGAGTPSSSQEGPLLAEGTAWPSGRGTEEGWTRGRPGERIRELSARLLGCDFQLPLGQGLPPSTPSVQESSQPEGLPGGSGEPWGRISQLPHCPAGGAPRYLPQF